MTKPGSGRPESGQTHRLRLQRFLAQAGIGSRRACELLIQDGRVSVNGEVVRLLGSTIDPRHDQVRFDGRLLSPQRKTYLALHKPKGYLCTRMDPEGRPTVGDLLPPHWRTLNPVGRLDWDSEGLLFLTNDGQFALRLTHPRYGCRKIYEVVVEGRVQDRSLQELVTGVFEGGQRLKAERARVLKSSPQQTVVQLELAEGKNRQIRRMFALLGLTIRQLKRTQIGSVRLGGLHRGRWRTLTDREIDSLLQAL